MMFKSILGVLALFFATSAAYGAPPELWEIMWGEKFDGLAMVTVNLSRSNEDNRIPYAWLQLVDDGIFYLCNGEDKGIHFQVNGAATRGWASLNTSNLRCRDSTGPVIADLDVTIECDFDGTEQRVLVGHEKTITPDEVTTTHEHQTYSTALCWLAVIDHGTNPADEYFTDLNGQLQVGSEKRIEKE